ncbi:MAG: hypothetical protein J2P47_06455 [Acetobacteraceae bacterium]|nr:hypothetical protein [Acetobacteraceae bacterium]
MRAIPGTALRTRLRQRADYTHKHNLKTGRHGWLRLTPAYSVKVVEDLISERLAARRILDPFCGTATTALSAACHGHEGVTMDINPFLVWFGRTKLGTYSLATIDATRAACARALSLVQRKTIAPAPCPPIHNIKRWWAADSLDFLRATKAAIQAVTDARTAERALLQIAFCRTMIVLSNAAFNHQSMSFKDGERMAFARDRADIFAGHVGFVLSGAADNPAGSGRVLLGDARNPSAVLNGPFDLVVTSPPYANRISYIRELRPYMYWLDYLVDGRDAGDRDWSAIGGTWGIATSRLIAWKRGTDRLDNPTLQRVLEGISHCDNKSGTILANYVAKYFDDMWTHLQNLTAVLAPQAEVHYIVGNSTFYGILLSTEQIYAEMLAELGFSQIECRPIRKRNSKKELIEFDVTARWQN